MLFRHENRWAVVHAREMAVRSLQELLALNCPYCELPLLVVRIEPLHSTGVAPTDCSRWAPMGGCAAGRRQRTSPRRQLSG